MHRLWKNTQKNWRKLRISEKSWTDYEEGICLPSWMRTACPPGCCLHAHPLGWMSITEKTQLAGKVAAADCRELDIRVMPEVACQANMKQLIQVGQRSSVPRHVEEYETLS